ncbi:hypothetical protein BFF78_00695 [Streptomyces fodineus]|uniref:Serine peptidase n=1 Tax=Streptomyces fodineus TaxID=1904616 RepID=A0A1D7YN25_9ACTN|nr:hypothetical protein BFF78_00695 [Streptomyces fodineus]
MVGVHGIGQQLASAESLRKAWLPALREGLGSSGECLPLTEGHGDLEVAFYGDVFHRAGQTLAVGDPMSAAGEVRPGLEEELLRAWWEESARVDEGVVSPDADTLVRVPASVQAGLRALSLSRFFSGLTMRSLVSDLKQVSRYFTDPVVRAEAVKRVRRAVGPDTRVVVAHSLGSVVAYEALCASPGHEVRMLVTLGSPLGIRNLIFDRLLPEPGAWPGGTELNWTNISDAGDVVALVKDLRPAFGPRLVCLEVHNGSHAHDAVRYLASEKTGAAIARGLDVR